MKRINIFVGNYGSGKTELALNTAIRLKKEHADVVLADVDIVNPYFRAAEHKKMLEEMGIKVIMPEYATTGVDLPTLPPDIYSVFAQHAYAVLDCGGDPAGATALGALRSHIAKVEDELMVYFVINACRPFQSTADQTVDMLRVIEHVSRVKVNALINNTNLGPETTAREVALGQGIALEVSERLGLPLAYISGTKEVLAEYAESEPEEARKFFVIDIFTRPYWLT